MPSGHAPVAADKEGSLWSGFVKAACVASGSLRATRFPHPNEAGLLNTLPPSFKFPCSPRAALCLIGQIAAPLQALWIYSQLLHWAESHLSSGSEVCPEQLLQDFKVELLRQRDACWITQQHLEGGLVTILSDEAPLQLKVAVPTTVAALTRAEAALQGPGIKALAAHVDADQLLCPWHEPLQIHHVPKVQAKPDCRHQLSVLALTPVGVQHGRFPAGTLPSMVCAKFRLDPGNGLWDICTGFRLPEQGIFSSVAVDARAPCHFEAGATDSLVWTALRSLVEDACDQDWLVVPPSLASLLLCSGSVELSWLRGVFNGPGTRRPLLVIFSAHGHWALLCLEWLSASQLLARCYDGVPGRARAEAESLAAKLAILCEGLLLAVQEHCVFEQTVPNSCGAIALAHAACVIQGSVDDALPRAFALCVRLAEACSVGRCVAFGGLSPEQAKTLQVLLQEKGVPETLAVTRANAAVDKLGAKAIISALNAANPWQALKSAASATTPIFKFVLYSELQSHIAQRAASHHGAQVPDAKAKKSREASRKSAPPPVQVDPGHLLLAPGSFVGEDGTPVSQLSLAEVVSDAHGIAFCTPQQIVPFLDGFQSMSVSPLGLLTTAELPGESIAGIPAQNLRYPAIYGPTKEAVILSGTLVQVGDEQVTLAKQDIADVDQLETETLRIQVFRDETSLSWDEFHPAPFRALLAHIPGLSLCRDQGCKGDCCRYHCAIEEAADQLLLDIWSRQFLWLEGGKASPSNAAQFQALIRVPASARSFLQRLQVPGVYFEPRSQSGAEPHSQFAVIWLPGADFARASMLAKRNEKVVSVTRLGLRYGLRVAEADEASIFASTTRPGQEFVKIRIQHRFRLHPLPRGFQRKHLQQLLRKWGWKARPLRCGMGGRRGRGA